VTETIYYSVTAHHCLLGYAQYAENELVPGKKYVCVGSYAGDTIEEKDRIKQYRIMPKTCRCRKLTTAFFAEDLMESNEAQKVIQVEIVNGKIVPITDTTQIWSNFWTEKKSKVPRIDLVNHIDIQEAYVYLKDEFKKKIEDIHQMQMEFRAKLIVPFRPDPFDGRVLFPFTPDQRTSGGHNS
jgi:hypothetical protein